MEGGAEEGAIDGGVARRFRVVDVLASGAVEFHGLVVGDVGESHGEERVRMAHYAGTLAKVTLFVFLELFLIFYGMCVSQERSCGGKKKRPTILARPLVVTM